MSDELKRMGKKASVANFKVLPGIFLERLKKKKNFQ
jgi:hypothetical protein